MNAKPKQPLSIRKKLAFAAISIVVLWAVCEVCLRQEIPLFDLSPGFLANPDPEALFLDGNHYNAEGSRLIAEMLFQKLTANDTVFETGDEFYAAFETEMKQMAGGGESSRTDKENL